MLNTADFKDESQVKGEPYKNKVTVACVNFAPVLGDKTANLEKMHQFIVKASNRGAHIIVFPEMALTGYEVNVLPLAETIPGPSTQRIAHVAAKENVYVIFGMPELDKVDQKVVYNSAAVIAPTGIRGSYRKMHPFGPELQWSTPGSEFPVWQTEYGPIGIAICFDYYVFPEVARIYAIKGCRLLINPTAAGYFAGITDVLEAVLVALKARVVENSVFLASANLVGVENPTKFFGHSLILGPRPSSVAYNVYVGPASGEKEEMIIATLNLSLTDQFGYLSMRHPKNYAALTS